MPRPIAPDRFAAIYVFGGTVHDALDSQPAGCPGGLRLLGSVLLF